MTPALFILLYWAMVCWTAGLLMYEDIRNNMTPWDLFFYIVSLPVRWVVKPTYYVFAHTFKTRGRFRL